MRGFDGCATVGWQEGLQITSRVKRWVRHDAYAERAVQGLFRDHADTMPPFLHLGNEHYTRYRYARLPEALVMITECCSGVPSWDPGRSGHEPLSCQLASILAFKGELP